MSNVVSSYFVSQNQSSLSLKQVQSLQLSLNAGLNPVNLFRITPLCKCNVWQFGKLCFTHGRLFRLMRPRKIGNRDMAVDLSHHSCQNVNRTQSCWCQGQNLTTLSSGSRFVAMWQHTAKGFLCSKRPRVYVQNILERFLDAFWYLLSIGALSKNVSHNTTSVLPKWLQTFHFVPMEQMLVFGGTLVSWSFCQGNKQTLGQVCKVHVAQLNKIWLLFA